MREFNKADGETMVKELNLDIRAALQERLPWN